MQRGDSFLQLHILLRFSGRFVGFIHLGLTCRSRKSGNVGLTPLGLTYLDRNQRMNLSFGEILYQMQKVTRIYFL